MDLTYVGGKLNGIDKMFLAIKRNSKIFEVSIVEEGGAPEATIKNCQNLVTISVHCKKDNTLEDLLTEINVHLCDVR